MCPEDRVFNMTVVRTVLLSWKEAMTKLKCRSKHMPTCQTFDDAIIAVEGLMLYILSVTADNSDQHFIPWLFTSDACEQLYAFLRIGLHAGIKTNLCSKDVLKQAMKEGVSRARELLQEHCSFEGEAFQPSYDGAESDESETDDEEEDVEDIDSLEEWANIVTVYGSSMRAQYNDTSALHNVISVLLCSVDLISLRQNSSGLPPDIPCPVNNFQILQRTLDHDTKQLLISDNYSYLRKLLEEPTVMELEDIVQMMKHVSWENAKASKVVLSELLYYISSVHSSDMKPYLVFLLHILLIQDSWQRKRIQLVLKGGPERDTLLDIIQRSKSHHQKRAYQCMKCLTNLLSASTLAAEIFFEDADNKFRWEGAVNWLGVQLERRPGYHGNNPGSWANLSNETGNDFYIERSNSAVLVHQKVLFIIQVFP
ncbi:probable ubiquitin carboxyl-terminal hydrolase FAF-Y [Bolinopsis microptera]|uniref:probable ubiquitin carboxyl-terminal hydrolase FAF-Y n=1 Tax=Bolinopsis microptera TaxID=2820187 RepID=UPI00307A451E